MKRAKAAELFTHLIETQEAEGRDDTTPCLMLTGRWYKAFPKPPLATVPLPGNRGIFLLTLPQGRLIRDLLADEQTELEDLAIDVKSKASPAAVSERHRAREQDQIRALVKRSPGRYAREHLRKGHL